jgi:hypothetical protein
MLIVAWNMGCGAPSPYRRSHTDAWEYLLALHPDVAFVQEALRNAAPPPERGSTIWSADRGTGSGTAVFIRKGVTAKPVSMRSRGSYLAAVSTRCAGTPMLLASVHVGSGDYKENRRVLARTLVKATADRRFVVGGDVNAARHWDAVYGGRSHTEFFKPSTITGFMIATGRNMDERYRASGVTRPGRPTSAITSSLTGRPQDSGHVQNCVVVDNSDVRALSDHALLRLELAFDLGARRPRVRQNE